MTDQPKKQHFTDDQGREWIRFNGKPSMLVAITQLSKPPVLIKFMQHYFKHNEKHYLLEVTQLPPDADYVRASRNLKHLAKWYLHAVLLKE